MSAHTVESHSTQEDWNETCERIYNRDVTLLQQECVNQVKITEDSREYWIERSVEKYQHLTMEQICTGVDKMIKIRIENLRRDLAKLIWGLKTNLEYQKRSFQEPPNSHEVSHT